MIEGVIVQKLKQIVDNRGKVMHMLRSDSPLFENFGEIYFSIVNPGVVKAWKKHHKITQHFAVPIGMIRLVFFDDRKDSLSYGKTEILNIGEDNYCLVRIPPLLWYGFKGKSSVASLIANCTNIPYDPQGTEQKDSGDNYFSYNWE